MEKGSQMQQELSEKEKKSYMFRKVRNTLIILLPCVFIGARAAINVIE